MTDPMDSGSRRVSRAPVIATVSGEVLVVTLNRPAKRNAMNIEAIEQLRTLFSNAPAGVRVAIICATGEHFSAGLDLADLAEREEDDLVSGIAHSQMWHRAFQEIEFGRFPVISVLKGAVIGGGLELAAATHIRIAEATAFYALPEGQRGIFVGGGGSFRLPRLIGIARMMDMMLTGRTYSAAEGHAIGISQYLVNAGEGLEKAKELANAIVTNTPLTNFAVMHALPRIADANPDTAYLMEALMSSIAQNAEDAKKRMRAFLEKRATKVEAPH